MTADRSERRGLKDGNDRVPTIARWLGQRVPAKVKELVLTAWTAEEDPEVLARWDRKDVSPELATDISALIAEYADDAGTHCKAQLSWVVDEDSRPHSSKRFRGVCRRESEVMVRPLDGTLTSLITQLQRHNEVILETTMRERTASDARIERIIGLMDAQLQRAHERMTALEQHRDDLEETAAEAVEAAEEAAETAESALEQAEEASKGQQVAQVIDMISKQLMPGG